MPTVCCTNHLPLLFLIFTNDRPNAYKRLTFFLFADDTNIYYESRDLAYLTNTVNKELRLVKKWLDANKLSINIDKIKCQDREETDEKSKPC